MPNPNVDGTTQVAPPIMSAFGQPGQQPMPPQAAPPPAQAQSGTPGFAGAILDLMKALSGAFAPRSIVQRGKSLDKQIDEGSGKGLGDQF